MAGIMLLCMLCFVTVTHSHRTAVDFMEQISNITYIRQPPAYSNKNATQVRLGIYINDVYDIGNKGQMTFTLNMYLRINWRDPRLAFNPIDYGDKQTLYLPDNANNKIWFPDVFFRNGREVKFSSLERENNLLLVNSSGHVRYMRQLTSTLSCFMKYTKYPFDVQICDIQIESFRYQTNVMTLKWLYIPLSADPRVEYQEFLLMDGHFKDCTEAKNPCLKAKITFVRDVNHFYAQLFFPTILLVIVSWFSFWMESHKYSERVCLLCILLLILTCIYIYRTAQVPYITKLTALDAWMVICYCFIFMPLLQATLFKMFGCKYGRKDTQQQNITITRAGCHSQQTVDTINLLCKIIFPLLFLVTVIVYFSMCNA